MKYTFHKGTFKSEHNYRSAMNLPDHLHVFLMEEETVHRHVTSGKSYATSNDIYFGYVDLQLHLSLEGEKKSNEDWNKKRATKT